MRCKIMPRKVVCAIHTLTTKGLAKDLIKIIKNERKHKTMATIRKITRTITTTEVTALAVTQENTLETVIINVPEELNEKNVLKKAQAFGGANTVVKVLDFKHKTRLYKMPEADFIAHATEITEC